MSISTPLLQVKVQKFSSDPSGQSWHQPHSCCWSTFYLYVVFAVFGVCDWRRCCKALWDVKFSQTEGNGQKCRHIAIVSSPKFSNNVQKSLKEAFCSVRFCHLSESNHLRRTSELTCCTVYTVQYKSQEGLTGLSPPLKFCWTLLLYTTLLILVWLM